MLKKTISWKDFDGNDRKEDFYFNLSKPEVIELQSSMDGGLDKAIEQIVNAQDKKQIVDVFKRLILTSYGIKSPDGKRFMKSEEISKEFSETGAYEVLFMELASNEKVAEEFMNSIIPKVEAKQNNVVPMNNSH